MMYLLDSHTFLWYINDDKALTVTAKALIKDQENAVFVSIASLWEIAIKVSLGKLKVRLPFTEFMNTQLRENKFILSEIKTDYLGVLATLPFHHRDPFDRLIIAQSLSEDLPIIGKDDVFDTYGVKRVW